MITAEEEINDRVNHHFQTVAGSLPATSSQILKEWCAHYEPLPIDEHIYDSQLSDITLDELNEILAQCPNGKAAGVSGITYELVRYCSKQFKGFLIKLFNLCLKTGLTPTNW